MRLGEIIDRNTAKFSSRKELSLNTFYERLVCELVNASERGLKELSFELSNGSSLTSATRAKLGIPDNISCPMITADNVRYLDELAQADGLRFWRSLTVTSLDERGMEITRFHLARLSPGQTPDAGYLGHLLPENSRSR